MVLVSEIDNIFPSQPYLVALYKAMIITMYFGLFRISEVTQSDHVLKARDVRISCNKQKMLFILRTSKTHGHGSKLQTIKINSVAYDPLGQETDTVILSDKYCPYILLSNYLDVRKSKRADDSEQFFVFRDRSTVTAQHFCKVLKRLLISAGFNSEFYGTHSIRAGRTGDLLDLGVNFEVLKKLGCWKSGVMVYTYLKP